MSVISRCLRCTFLASPLLISIMIVHIRTHTARAPHVSISIMGCGGWLLSRNVISPSPSVGMRNDEGHEGSAPKLHAVMISGDWVVMRGGVPRE